MEKIYYKIQFELKEALSLGNGENRYSDGDLLRDGKGDPFVPGTSLAGVYRHFLQQVLEEKDVDYYFGSVKKLTSEIMDSKVCVYHAKVKDNRYVTSVRDSVALDEYKIAKDGAKFDFEVIEPGATFITYIEQTRECDTEKDIGAILADAFLSNQFCIGRKTMRGYGRVGNATVWRKIFSLDKPEELDKWIEFDMYASNKYKDKDKYVSSKSFENLLKQENQICLGLRLTGGIDIRRYMTSVAKTKEDGIKEAMPAYIQMSYERGEGLVPCILGTTWAGAFRHKIEGFMDAENRSILQHEIFGMKTNDAEMQKSKIRFDESVLEGGEWKVLTRNTIDRFTGGTVDSALYTEKLYYGGTTTLTISYNCCVEEKVKNWKHLLAAAMADLNSGFLSIGGLTAVGRGIFEVESCQWNGKEIYKKGQEDDAQETMKLYQAIVGVEKGGCVS